MAVKNRKRYRITKYRHNLVQTTERIIQIKTLSQQLGLGCQLKEWCREATSIHYGQLLIDLTPKTNDPLGYCTKNGSISSKFDLAEGKKIWKMSIQ